MGKLLETRLPIAFNEVDPSIYNRMVRILELGLNSFDPTAQKCFTGIYGK